MIVKKAEDTHDCFPTELIVYYYFVLKFMTARSPELNPKTATPKEIVAKLTIEFGGIFESRITLPETLQLFSLVSQRLPEVTRYLQNYPGLLVQNYGGVMWNIISSGIDRYSGLLHPKRGGTGFREEETAAFSGIQAELDKKANDKTRNPEGVHRFGNWVLLEYLREPNGLPYEVFEAFSSWSVAISSDDLARQFGLSTGNLVTYDFVYGPFRNNLFFDSPSNGVNIEGSVLNRHASEYRKFLV